VSLLLACALLLPALGFASSVYAAVVTDADIGSAVAHADEMIAELELGNRDQAAASFGLIKKWWNANKKTVKEQSLDMSLEIDRQMASLSLAFLNKEMRQAEEEAGSLRISLQNYADGAFTDNAGKQRMTLGTYVLKLRRAADLMTAERWQEAQAEVKLLQRQWLSVEGDVVSQSQTVYNNAERDLVLMDAYLSGEEKRDQARPIAERMVQSLTPLIDAHYSWWDAALIPLREGIEALLVVGTLLMYAGKSASKAAKRWVVGGTSAGVLLCIVVGFIVAFLLSSSAFRQNNSLINGWTGVLASLLLLYVSYWLHRNADVQRWTKFLRSKSNQALTSGKMASLALLAFFAIVREGLETVIFLIGMAGKMSVGELTGGIAAGFGILGICAVVMIKLGNRLPIRPVFLVSSAIVFYLCFKFMGSGIHSLQMAGIVPSAVHEYLPEYGALSLYPSWYSTLPQLLFVLIAVGVLVRQRFTAKT
jgi:high-affinity iron transporter